jgi:hypothetical protein
MNKILTFLVLAFLLIPNLGHATSTAAPPPDVKFQALDANGDPYSGGKLYTYETGTSTPKTTWTSSTKGSANANPVVLDSKGAADVWLDSSGGAYRFLLKDSDDTTIWTIDGIYESRPIAVDPVWLVDHEADGDHKAWKLLSQFNTLYAAQADVGTDYILIIDEDVTMAQNVTFTASQIVKFTPGSVIDVDTYTLTIYQNADWGNSQIFDTSNGGAVHGPALVNVTWFGAVAAGASTDVESEVQDAIDTITWNGSGTVYFPPCNTYYDIGDQLEIQDSMYIIGDQTMLRCSGTNDTLFLVEDDTASTAISDGLIKGFIIDGTDALADIAIHLSSARNWIIEDVYAYDFGLGGILIDDDNGLSSAYNVIRDYRWDCMVDASSSTAYGIKLTGETDGVGCYNNYIEFIQGTYDDGNLVTVEGRGSGNVFGKIHATLESGGTGYALDFQDGASNHPNRNYVEYMKGEVHAEANTYGNVIHILEEEDGSVALDSGADMYYGTIDKTTGVYYETPPYRMRDSMWIGVGDMDIESGTVIGTAGGNWRAYEFQDAADESVSFAVPGKPTWGDGDIVSYVLWYCGDDAATTEYVIVDLELGCFGDGDLMTTADNTDQDTFLMNDVASTLERTSQTLSSAVAYTEGDMIVCTITRNGDDGSDNFTGTWELFGMELVFEGDGPTAGSFDLP